MKARSVRLGSWLVLAGGLLVSQLLSAPSSRAQTSVLSTLTTSIATTLPPSTSAPLATSTTVVRPPASPLKKLALQTVASGLVEPVDVAAPLDDGLLFVLQRSGTVRVVENGRAAKDPFLDLKGFVKANSIEQGLLGIAFHPKYPVDRRVFVFHTRKDNDNLLVSYNVAADGRRVDPASRSELLRVDKAPDAIRHNAGALRFGPDGLLYISVGDGARAKENGQNPKTLLGSILRIDINTAPYVIPPGNPFADGKNGRPEVWWFGFRNPWRFSIDAKSGLAYIGDVGQETIEEINVVKFDTPGLNFGWPLMQGSKPYLKGTAATPLVNPVVEVRHDDNSLPGCSITGGEVYRGAAIPELDGHYFYADWCFGWIQSFRYDGAAAVDRKNWKELAGGMISSFGHDAKGELLVVNYEAGLVSRIVAVR
jgi:glucose/arabinose dehydrogenase